MTKHRSDWCDAYAAKLSRDLAEKGQENIDLTARIRTAYRRGVADTKVAYGTYEFTHEGRDALKRRIAALKRGKS